MRKPPKALEPLIAVMSRQDAGLDELTCLLNQSNTAQLKRNAFHVLQALPGMDSAANALKFATVHSAIGSDKGVFAMIASDSCLRGTMGDDEAYKAITYMLDQGWMREFTALLFYACAYSKPKCATYFASRGIYRSPRDWKEWLYGLNDNQTLQMARLLIEVAAPSREDLMSLRLSVKSGTPAASFLDRHLNVVVNESDSVIKH